MEMSRVALLAVLVASIITIVLGGAIHGDKKEVEGSTDATVPVPASVQRFPASLARAKRYTGWGRRPGLRYSKASSAFDFDNTFNKIYNKYEKRGHGGPEAPISNFRELRMKQKVPNAQLLLPHLFNRNARIPPPGALDIDGDYVDVEGGNGRLTEEDIDALMFLLEEYAKRVQSEQ